MKKYYIYEIPGVKIGCSTQPKERVEKQGFTEYVILEEHTDIDIASERELILQKEKGYPVDKSDYKTSVKNRPKWSDNPEMQRELSLRVKNRFVWDSAASSKGMKTRWKRNYDVQYTQAIKALNKATEAASVSPNRSSLKMYKCLDCGKEIKGSAPAARHSKAKNHKVEKI